ncbi:MAG: hypothetical protein NT007_01605 [Candidatus Kapabacteria bacterium]|nr:hypothetical protein [Candidatus Kapabacteria bacterium]
MKKLNGIIALLFILLSIVLYAQEKVDIIYLTNGDILRGQIIKDVSGDFLQLEMKNGLTKKINYSDIEKRESQTVNNANTLQVNSSNNFNSSDTSSISFNELLYRGFDVNLILFNLNYTEDVTPPLKSTESGLIKGLNICFSTNKKFSFRVNASLHYSWAEENYDGSTQQGEPLQSKTNSSFFRLNANLFYNIVLLNGRMNFAPFIGYDIRSWDRKLGGSGGYEEIYSWASVPIGFKSDYQINKKFNIGIIAQVNLMVNGKIKILLSQLKSTNPDIVLTLGNITAFELNLPMSFYINKMITFNFAPYYEQYGFGKSNIFNFTNGSLWEPSSNTSFFGVKTGLAFSF